VIPPITGNGRISVSKVRDRHTFVMTVRPDIAIRVKRWLLGSVQSGGQIIRVDANPQNAHDLATLLHGHPMDLDDEARALLDDLCTQHHERAAAVAAVARGEAPIGLPANMAIPPRPYQLDVVALLRATRGLLLADDMGLGKTISAIACVCEIAEMRPAIVVVPSGVLPAQWSAQFHRFAPTLTTHVVRKGSPYNIVPPPEGGVPRKRKFVSSGGYNPDEVPDVLIIGYGMIKGWAEVLAAPPWRSVIYDEVQSLRYGADTDKGAAAQSISAHALYRLGLSGTPVYNYGNEMHAIGEVVAPGFLGSKQEFEREWCDQSNKRVKEPDALGLRLRESGVMLRRRRADVGRELPPVSTIIRTVDCDPAALTAVSGQAGELARTLLSQMNVTSLEKLQASQQMINMLRLATGIAKAVAVAQFVRELVSEGRRVVLYGWHRAVYDIWLQSFDEVVDHKRVRYAMITGSETAATKTANVAAFVADGSDIDVLIVSLRAGAGMDGLQHVCSTVVFGELDWSPKVHDQCTTRLDRDGQTENVQAFFCAARVGIDPIMVDVCGAKRRQSGPMMDPDQFFDASLLEAGAPEDLVKRIAESVVAGDLLREREVDDV
jgi:SNF2 family DNA or RNA helicase